jgi:hypothetical protein
MSKEPAPRGRWLIWGATAGALFGAGYAWLGCRFLGEGANPAILATSLVLGGVSGCIFAAWYHAARPPETSLCTWLGMLLGAIPAAGLFLLVAGPANRLGVYGLAAVAFLPVVSGLFFGGLLDRMSEGFLYTDASEDDPPA